MAAQLPGHFGRMTLSASSRSAPASGRGSPAESVVIEETSFDGVAGVVAWAEISVEEALKQQRGQEQIGCRIRFAVKRKGFHSLTVLDHQEYQERGWADFVNTYPDRYSVYIPYWYPGESQATLQQHELLLPGQPLVDVFDQRTYLAVRAQQREPTAGPVASGSGLSSRVPPPFRHASLIPQNEETLPTYVPPLAHTRREHGLPQPGGLPQSRARITSISPEQADKKDSPTTTDRTLVKQLMAELERANNEKASQEVIIGEMQNSINSLMEQMRQMRGQGQVKKEPSSPRVSLYAPQPHYPSQLPFVSKQESMSGVQFARPVQDPHFVPMPTSNFARMPQPKQSAPSIHASISGAPPNMPPLSFPGNGSTLKADMKFPEPKGFSGRREDCHSFLHDIETYFYVTNVTDDTIKIIYGLRLLEAGLPLQWKRHQELMWSQTGNCPFSSWRQLHDEIWAQFGPIAEEEKAQREIQRIRQGNKNIDEFNREFLMIVHQLPAGWESALVSFYKQALSPQWLNRVYTLMVLDPPKTLQEWINTTHMLYLRDMEKQANLDAYGHSSAFQSSQKSHQSGFVPTRKGIIPMAPRQQENTHSYQPRRGLYDPKSGRNWVPAQKKDRPAKPTAPCYVCGKEGHWANVCPDKGKSRNPKMKIRALTAEELEYLSPEEVQDWQERYEEQFAAEMDEILQVRKIGVEELYPPFVEYGESTNGEQEEVSNQDFH